VINWHGNARVEVSRYFFEVNCKSASVDIITS
jgi:hypothetical protein